jgi:hypothetical protein
MVGYEPEELKRLLLSDVAEDQPRLRQHLAAVLGKGGDRCEMRPPRGSRHSAGVRSRQ